MDRTDTRDGQEAEVAGTLWAALFLSALPSVLTVAGALVVLAGVFYGTVASGRASTPGAGA